MTEHLSPTELATALLQELQAEYEELRQLIEASKQALARTEARIQDDEMIFGVPSTSIGAD